MSFKVLNYFFSFAMILSCIAADAQQTQKTSAQIPQPLANSSNNSQNSKSQVTNPSPELQSLIKALAGKWSLDGKFESHTNGTETQGEETWRPGPGGFTLLEEEHLPMAQGDLFLLGIIWWNATTKDFHGMECQNLLPYTCDLKGALNDITMSWDGRQFAIEEQETHNGKKSIWHEVWSDITPTSFTQTGESEEPGGARKRLFTIHATRVTDAR